MRNQVKMQNLQENRSVVRYEDALWLYHGAFADPKTGKTKYLLSALRNGKMRLVHDRHRNKVQLAYHLADAE